MPNSLMKMDLQNVIYRYFAESARFFKKIQHSIRSGEAELMVICDGEEPRADDLNEAFQEFLDEVKAFASWAKTERLRLNSNFDDKEVLNTGADGRTCLAVGAGGAFATTSTLWVIGALQPAAILPATGVLSVIGAVAWKTQDCDECASSRKSPPDRKWMPLWQGTAQAEEEVVSFLLSLRQEFQTFSYKQALEKAKEFRSKLDGFLQLLQMEGLIVDPCSMSSRFQSAPGRVGRNL